MSSDPSHHKDPSTNYRRGAVMGMTMAEAFVLITFALLLLLALWKVQDDQERQVYQVVAGLSPQDLMAAAALQESGQLQTVSELVGQGADFRTPETTPETRDRWRLIDKDELHRIVDGVENLPEDIQRDLADLVEITEPARLRQVLEVGERGLGDEIAVLSDENVAAAAKLAESGQLEAATELAESGQLEAVADLVQQGADFRAPETTPATRDDWRIVADEGLQRLLDGMVNVPAPIRTELADLIESEEAEGIARLLEAAADTTGEAELEDRLAGIGRRLASAEEEAQSLVRSLREELGARVSAVGGMIDDNGSIVLPDTVLFEQGSAQITPVMQEFLNSICEPWMRELMTSPAPVVSARIEGHASSEWRQETSSDEAYLKNLALSQARSQSVLDACLRIVSPAEIRGWAHAHLAAVGYSSGQPILLDGAEDPNRSRRVVFSMALDDEKLLQEVASDVATVSDVTDVDAGHDAFLIR